MVFLLYSPKCSLIELDFWDRRPFIRDRSNKSGTVPDIPGRLATKISVESNARPKFCKACLSLGEIRGRAESIDTRRQSGAYRAR